MGPENFKKCAIASKIGGQMYYDEAWDRKDYPVYAPLIHAYAISIEGELTMEQWIEAAKCARFGIDVNGEIEIGEYWEDWELESVQRDILGYVQKAIKCVENGRLDLYPFL